MSDIFGGLTMLSSLIISFLQSAEDQVANGEQDIADQCDLVSTLERTGHPATCAIARQRQMEQAQMQRIADRESLRAELTALNAGEAARVGDNGSKKPVE